MKHLMVAVLAIVCLESWSDASVYKGQKEYMKQCKKCHGSGTKLSQKFTMDEWRDFFANSGAKLIQIHQKDANASKYFQSERFKKKVKHLRQFFEKFAADSGNVPACSD